MINTKLALKELRNIKEKWISMINNRTPKIILKVTFNTIILLIVSRTNMVLNFETNNSMKVRNNIMTLKCIKT